MSIELVPTGVSHLPSLEDGYRALIQASDDFERLRIRDRAKAIEAAASVIKRKDVQVHAANLVATAEREIARANPPKPPGPKDPLPRGADLSDDPPINSKVLSKIRSAHAGITDEEFDQQKAEAIENQEPLTRKAIKQINTQENPND